MMTNFIKLLWKGKKPTFSHDISSACKYYSVLHVASKKSRASTENVTLKACNIKTIHNNFRNVTLRKKLN